MTGERTPRPVGSTTHRRRDPTTIDTGTRSGGVDDHLADPAPRDRDEPTEERRRFVTNEDESS